MKGDERKRKKTLKSIYLGSCALRVVKYNFFPAAAAFVLERKRHFLRLQPPLSRGYFVVHSIVYK
jgi:hypothetical protein